MAAAMAVPASRAADDPRGAVSVIAFGADPSGRSDSSAAFTAAIAKSSVVRVPEGRYIVGNVELRQGLTLRGDGERSVLVQRAGSAAILHMDSGSPRLTADDPPMMIAGLQLRGASDSAGFSEHVHLVAVQGVNDLTIENCTFRGFQGDGLYLGGSGRQNAERHNHRVAVRRCVFDGVNRANRNGISVIDCDGLIVSACEFRDMTQANMPGAIDLEPNANRFHRLRNIHITGNRFKGIGGIGGAIAMNVPVELDEPPSHFVFEDNTMENIDLAAFNLVQAVPSKDDADQKIVIRNNTVSGRTARPFVLRGVTGVEVTHNQFSDTSDSAIIGFRDVPSRAHDVSLVENTFRHVGKDSGVAVAVFNTARLLVERNEFVDCGNGKPTSYVFDFNAGESTKVVFRRNRFSSPSGMSRFVVQKEASHRFDADSNVFGADNVIEGPLKNAFPARDAR